MKGIVMALFMLSACQMAKAKSFGVIGEVFPVAEMSFLALIEERLKTLGETGEMDEINQRWVNTVTTHTNRPKPLNLPRALKTKRHYYKPEIVLSHSIADNQGRVLFAKGARVNALSELPTYSPCWLLFNADDKAQLLWAQKQKSQCANPKLILTGGAVGLAEKALQSVIYFDQGARISLKLNIATVPAKVVRHKNLLQITEVAITESGDVL